MIVIRFTLLFCDIKKLHRHSNKGWRHIRKPGITFPTRLKWGHYIDHSLYNYSSDLPVVDFLLSAGELEFEL